MSVTPSALREQRALADRVGAHTDDTVRALTELWLAEWDSLADAWQQAEAEYAEHVAATGSPPQVWQHTRMVALTAALLATQQALNGVVIAAAGLIAAGTARVVVDALAGEPAVMAAQLPAAERAAAAARWAASIPAEAADAVTADTGEQVRMLLWSLAAETATAVRRSLVVRTASDGTPNSVAARMVAAADRAFHGGLARAVNIARTEHIDAWRNTAARVHDANTDVLDGWLWWCACDVRSCPACWAMHGTRHPLDEPGPLGHPGCRCARMPLLKPWPALGHIQPEPDRLPPTGPERFAQMSAAQQLAVMGPGRLALLKSGRIGWDDLVVRRTNTGWRDSHIPRTVRDLQRIAAQRTT